LEKVLEGILYQSLNEKTSLKFQGKEIIVACKVKHLLEVSWNICSSALGLKEQCIFLWRHMSWEKEKKEGVRKIPQNLLINCYHNVSYTLEM
jgi:hypothetical protein